MKFVERPPDIIVVDISNMFVASTTRAPLERTHTFMYFISVYLTV